MKNLKNYLECEVATPGNTLGAGNPGVEGDLMTEPIQDFLDKRPKTNKHKLKNKMKDLKEQLYESLENIKEARTNGYIEFKVYDRGMSDDYRKAKFFAKDLYDAVKLIVDHVTTSELHFEWYDEGGEYYLPDNAPKSKRDKVAKEAIARIDDENGDGCDYILNFTWNGKTYIEGEKGEDYSEEEIW